MSGIIEQLKQEHERKPGQVVLFESGLFYEAHELSAYLLWRKYSFKPSRRFFKNAHADVVSVGFPQDQLDKYLPRHESGGVGVVVGVLDGDEAGFKEWKQGLEQHQRNEVKVERALAGRFDNLPVYKECYDLLFEVVEWGSNLSKVLQHQVLDRMVDALYGVLTSICMARVSATESGAWNLVERARLGMVQVKLCLRLMVDKQRLPKESYARATMRVAKIDDQLTRWGQSLDKAKDAAAERNPADSTGN